MQDDRQLRDSSLWQPNQLGALLQLAWPITVSLVSFSLMTAVDTLFVGRLGAAALAGVGLGGAASFTVVCFGVGLLRSAKIAVARAAGAGNERAIRAYLGAGLWIALAVGVATAALGQVIALALPWLMSSPASGHAARTYMALRTLGAPIVLAVVAMRETRHGLGDARAPMVATLIANVANVGLVAAFSLGAQWGVAGVASATLLAQLLEAVLLAVRERRQGFGLSVPSRQELSLLLELGVPLGIERFFDVSSFTLMVALFARMGDVDLAAHQIASQAVLFAFMPSMAIGDAACVLIGQSVGARDLSRVPRIQRSAVLLGALYVAVCSCVLLSCATVLCQLFTDDAVVIARSAQLLRVAAVFVWALPLYQVGQSSLRALGDVRVAALITVGSAWGCTPLLAAVLGLWLGLGALGGWVGLGAELGLAAWMFWWRLRAQHAAELAPAPRLSRDVAPQLGP